MQRLSEGHGSERRGLMGETSFDPTEWILIGICVLAADVLRGMKG